MGSGGSSSRSGRGGASGSSAPNGRRMSLARFLSQQDIDHANAASVTDMGDNIKRMFERNANEINGLDLPDAEKKEAVQKMASLATAALKDAAKAVNPYASGPARLTTAQKTGSAADRAANARGAMDGYMRQLRDKSSANRREREKKALTNALMSAQKSGALEVTVNGKTYRRARRNSSTWRPV